ncbi:hypothetical protein [Spirosoma litoris]
MRQRLNPWAVIVTAGLTFGSLMTFIGPHAYSHRGWGYYSYQNHHDWHNHGDCKGHHTDKQPDAIR